MTSEEFTEQLRQRVAQDASNRLARAYNGIASDLIEMTFAFIYERVRAGDEVRIPEFGVFFRRSVVGRKQKDPQGRDTRAPTYARVGFRPFKSTRWAP